MDILMTGRHVEVSEDIRDYIRAKAKKLERFYDRIQEIEVVFDHESEQFTAEMIVRVERKHTFVSSDSGPDTFALIDQIVEKLQRQLKKHKEKVRQKKGGTPADGRGKV